MIGTVQGTHCSTCSTHCHPPLTMRRTTFRFVGEKEPDLTVGKTRFRRAGHLSSLNKDLRRLTPGDLAFAGDGI